MSKFFYDIYNLDGEKIYSSVDCNEAYNLIGIRPNHIAKYARTGMAKSRKWIVERAIDKEIMSEWDITTSKFKRKHPQKKRMKKGWAR